MNILKDKKIKTAIANCNPNQIAVAYLGIDWESYIPNYKDLECVIISPTIGSNPHAITSLAKAIGWDRIYFLDELHSKIYLGEKTAIIGSSNLTYNGLSGQSLIELCVEIVDIDNLKEISDFLKDLKIRAAKKYPSITSKKQKVQELEVLWGRGISDDVIVTKEKMNFHFNEFELLANDHFYVVWYQQPILITRMN